MMAADDARKRGLGRGLSALLGEESTSRDDGGATGPGNSRPVSTMPVEMLRPSPLQPRKHFDDEAFAALLEGAKRCRNILVKEGRLPEEAEEPQRRAMLLREAAAASKSEIAHLKKTASHLRLRLEDLEVEKRESVRACETNAGSDIAQLRETALGMMRFVDSLQALRRILGVLQWNLVVSRQFTHRFRLRH